jgi:hypothetical protein
VKHNFLPSVHHHPSRVLLYCLNMGDTGRYTYCGGESVLTGNRIFF